MCTYPQTYQIEAGKKALKMYDDALQDKLNICLESTLAGRGTMQRIIAAKTAGYFTIAYYIGLNSVELNLERIAMRVARGGHNIAEDTVRRRFYNSANNLVQVKDYLDEIYLLDNSETYFSLQYSLLNKNMTAYLKSSEVWATDLVNKLQASGQ